MKKLMPLFTKKQSTITIKIRIYLFSIIKETKTIRIQNPSESYANYQEIQCLWKFPLCSTIGLMYRSKIVLAGMGW